MTELSNPARSRALLIGAHSFTHPDLEALPAVARNLTRLAALVGDPSVWGLAAEHLSVLAEPDRDRTLEEVSRLADEAEDTLLIYYAGHGFVHDMSNELYLALPRTDPNRLYSALRYQDIRELPESSGPGSPQGGDPRLPVTTFGQRWAKSVSRARWGKSASTATAIRCPRR